MHEKEIDKTDNIKRNNENQSNALIAESIINRATTDGFVSLDLERLNQMNYQ